MLGTTQLGRQEASGSGGDSGSTTVTSPPYRRLLTEVAIKLRAPGVSVDGSAWLFVLLALLTILPAACVLWFMNDALTRESAASHQRVLEAYRGQLRLVRSRLDPIWSAHATSLNTSAVRPERRFADLTAEGSADGAILLTADGEVEYPDRAREHGDGRRGARDALTQQLASAAAAHPDVRGPIVESIAARLNDYSASMPATHRLMLMDQLRRLAPNVSIPTEAALRLSVEMLDAERPVPMPEMVRQTATPGVWALTSEDQRVITFYRIGRLEAMMHDFLHQIAPSG